MRIKQYEKFLIDNGIIFEINRTILHPVGLELVVETSFDNRRKLSITGLEETEDEDGFIYDDESFDLNSQQFGQFVQSKKSRIDHRKKSLGFIVQKEKANLEK
jgi:hypothetical protein